MSVEEKLALEFVTNVLANPMKNFAIPPHLLPEYLRFGELAGNQYLLSTIFIAGWKAKEREDEES